MFNFSGIIYVHLFVNIFGLKEHFEMCSICTVLSRIYERTPFFQQLNNKAMFVFTLFLKPSKTKNLSYCQFKLHILRIIVSSFIDFLSKCVINV